MPESFTCPFCGRTSWNRHDVVEEYCGSCHVFVGDLEQLEPVPMAEELARVGLARVVERNSDGAPSRYWIGVEGNEALGAVLRRNGRRGALLEARRPKPQPRTDLPSPAEAD